MADPASRPTFPPEIRAYYESGVERSRLERGRSQLELARTQEILLSSLPPPPATILDVGGGPGVYATWLAGLGYEVHLVDPVPLHIEQARQRNEASTKPLASLLVGDARELARSDASVDAVLLLGPLYHLVQRVDRLLALREARRVLEDGGLVIAAAISRLASVLDGVVRDLTADPRFVHMAERDLAQGLHVNDTGKLEYFTTAYFHRPDELQREVEDAGFSDVQILGVEGPGWVLPEFEQRWSDPGRRSQLLRLARSLEKETSAQGISKHLVALGRKRV